MSEKQKQSLIDQLPGLLIPDRQFPPRTPHTYAHTGATVLRRLHLLPTQQTTEALGSNVRSLYPDLPEATIYYFPRESQ